MIQQDDFLFSCDQTQGFDIRGTVITNNMENEALFKHLLELMLPLASLCDIH